MLLSLRGWGLAEFTAAAPEFLAGARYALFVEKLAPVLSEAEAVLTAPLPPTGPEKLAAASRKLTVEKLIPALRTVLFPEDDDG